MSDWCGISDCRWVPAVHGTVYIAERRWRCGCDLSQALLVPRTKTGEHHADAGPVSNLNSADESLSLSKGWMFLVGVDH